MKKSCFFLVFYIFFLIVITPTLFAQSADKVTEILASRTLNFNQASYFGITWLNSNDENITDTKAAEKLLTLFPELERINLNKPLTYEQSAYFFMRVFKMSGGLLYLIFPSPRYAFREFKALGLIQAGSDPENKISGREFMHFLMKSSEIAEMKQKEKEKKIKDGDKNEIK